MDDKIISQSQSHRKKQEKINIHSEYIAPGQDLQETQLNETFSTYILTGAGGDHNTEEFAT